MGREATQTLARRDPEEILIAFTFNATLPVYTGTSHFTVGNLSSGPCPFQL